VIGHWPVCPQSIDTWWQTETGGVMISPCRPATRPTKAGVRALPLPGIAADLVRTAKAASVGVIRGGYPGGASPLPG